MPTLLATRLASFLSAGESSGVGQFLKDYIKAQGSRGMEYAETFCYDRDFHLCSLL